MADLIAHRKIRSAVEYRPLSIQMISSLDETEDEMEPSSTQHKQAGTERVDGGVNQGILWW